MYCPTCKQDFPAAYRFCPACCTRLENKTAAAPNPQTPQSEQTVLSGFPEMPNAFSQPGCEVPEFPPVFSQGFQDSDPQKETPENIPENRMEALKNILGKHSPDTMEFQKGSRNENLFSAEKSAVGFKTHSPAAEYRGFQRRATEYDIPDEAWLKKLPLRVEYAVNRYILSQSAQNEAKKPITLELQIQQTDRPLVAIHAWMVINAGREHETLYLDRNWERRHGNRLVYFLPYDLKWGLAGGDILLDFYLMCQFSDQMMYFTFHVKHAVIPSKLRSEQIVNQYVITAQDGSVVKDFDMNVIGHDAETIIDSLNSCPPFFQPMALQETDWRPEDYLISNASVYSRYACEKMTLEYGDYMIHLCSLDTIKLGRSFSQNNIVISDWSSETAFLEYPSRTVSKCHGVIRYLGDKVAYEDVSTFGTMIKVGANTYTIHRCDDERNPAVGQAPLDKCKFPEKCTIGFGGITMAAEIQACPVRKKNAMCRNCMQRMCSGLILHRQDQLPETFLFLWQCCDLGKIHPDLTGLTLFRRNDGYILRMEDNRLFVLAPEMALPLKNGGRLVVSKFYQPRY